MKNNLQQFRNEKKLSQNEISDLLGISTSFYIKIELGIRNPSYNFLRRFKEIFNCEIDKIFFS